MVALEQNKEVLIIKHLKVTQEQINFILKNDNIMTNEEIAKALGLSRGTISKIRKENGLSKLFIPNKEEFINKYEELKSSRKMGIYYNVDKATILNFAKKIGYRNKYANERLLDENQIQEVILSYDTSTAISLAKQYNCSKERIQQVWMKNGKKGKNNRSFYCDFDYFQEIDTPDKAYFLGFIAADGCVYSRNKNNTQKWLKIAIHRKDREILELFNKYIKGNNTIRDYDVNVDNIIYHYSDFTIVSDKICTDLAKYNIVERKTWTYEPANIPEKIIFHFLRGYFDGDGTIAYRNLSDEKKPSDYTISYCGNKKTMSFIHNKLKEYDINSYLYKDKRVDKYSQEFYYVILHNVKEMYKFINNIYENSDQLRMTRKYKRAEEFLDLYSKIHISN